MHKCYKTNSEILNQNQFLNVKKIQTLIQIDVVISVFFEFIYFFLCLYVILSVRMWYYFIVFVHFTHALVREHLAERIRNCMCIFGLVLNITSLYMFVWSMGWEYLLFILSQCYVCVEYNVMLVIFNPCLTKRESTISIVLTELIILFSKSANQLFKMICRIRQ